MALKYVVKKTVFGFDGTKTAKFVARPLLAGTVGYTDFCDQIAKRGMISRGVARMVLDVAVDVLEWNMENNFSVKLDDFGTFRPGFGSKTQEAEEKVNADVLRHRKIIFTTGCRFKKMLSGVKIQKCEIPDTDETAWK